jgi:hypothetical protein
MARIIDRRHIAVLYETITGECQKRGSIAIVGDDTLDLDAYLAKHPGQEAVIIPRSSHPGPDHNEHFCRQAIADHTGAPYFPHGADRAVMVHPAGHIVSIHLGNVPGLDHTLLPTSEIGTPAAEYSCANMLSYIQKQEKSRIR